MGFVHQNLIPGEKVEYETRVHWKTYLPALLWLLVSLVFFGFGLWFVGAPLLLLASIVGVAAHVHRISSEFAVTNRRVLIKVGIVGRRTVDLLLSKVEAIGVDQPLLGRMFGYGSLIVTGTGGTKERFSNIASPLQFRHEVQRWTVALTEPEPEAAGSLPPTPGQALPSAFCPRCGARCQPGARFCSGCGGNLSP